MSPARPPSSSTTRWTRRLPWLPRRRSCSATAPRRSTPAPATPSSPAPPSSASRPPPSRSWWLRTRSPCRRRSSSPSSPCSPSPPSWARRSAASTPASPSAPCSTSTEAMAPDFICHQWEPIADLPDGWQELRRDDLHLVHQQWMEEKSILRDPKKIEQLEERLSTEWAIETGIIERLYTVERGVTETLIELGLEAVRQFHESGVISQDAMLLIQDQRAALEFVFQFIRQERALSASYIKELHQLLTQSQTTSEAVDQFGKQLRVELIRGEWKKLPNNPTLPDGRIHEYCPPDFVQDEIEQLVGWYRQHPKLNVDVEIEAAWLHHRFTQIHPFQA